MRGLGAGTQSRSHRFTHGKACEQSLHLALEEVFDAFDGGGWLLRMLWRHRARPANAATLET